MVQIPSFRRPAPVISGDPANTNRVSAPRIPIQTTIGTVGYEDQLTALPEGTPAWMRWEQGECLVEVTLKAEDRIVCRCPDGLQIQEGQQVVVVLDEGEPEQGTIVCALNDANFPTPSSVGGVSTGAGDAQRKGDRFPASTWHFTRLVNGRMLAIQTNDQDVNVWAGAGVHIKAVAGAIHLDGTTHLGVGPASSPIGSQAAPGGEEIPGVPAVPYAPTPYTAPGPQAPTATPYVGLEDGLVRARDLYQSNVTIDPTFWANYAGIDAVARAINPALPPLPTNVYSAISGAAGPGSKHTATGDFEPAP